MIPSFVINLDDRVHRWKRFDRLSGININRIPAVDTRGNFLLKLKEFNLSLEPPDKLSKLYFRYSPGAVGCYLSHYLFWKRVVEQNLENAIVFEDDALITDCEKLLRDDKNFDVLNKDAPVLIQFNKRTTQEKLPFWFNGTESYALNTKAAQALIDLTHDFSEMQGSFIEYAWDTPNTGVTKQRLYDIWSVHDSKIDYTKKNVVRYPADKFIGYASHPSIRVGKRVQIYIRPKVSLYDNNVPSDILNDSKLWWNLNLEDIINLTKDL